MLGKGWKLGQFSARCPELDEQRRWARDNGHDRRSFERTMQLHVEIRGVGEPLLCLHGHPGSGRSMAVFTEHLSRQFRTIAPDLRGYGRSVARSPFAMDTHLADLVALLDRTGSDRCFVLGWSLGGILALELALRHPQRVAGLILVATAARPRGSHPPITWADHAYTAIASLINRAIPGWQWNINTFGQRSLYRYLLQQHTPAAYRRLATEGFPAYLRTSRHAQAALSAAIKGGYNRLPDVGRLTCPSLVLCGECDRHITPQSSQETAHALPNSTLKTYPHVAHLFPWEIPDQVRQDIETWLTQAR